MFLVDYNYHSSLLTQFFRFLGKEEENPDNNDSNNNNTATKAITAQEFLRNFEKQKDVSIKRRGDIKVVYLSKILHRIFATSLLMVRLRNQ